MKAAAAAVFGWLVPGGGYLLKRRYWQFALCFVLVCGTVCAGMAFRGASAWPQPEELQGLDSFSSGLAQAGALARALAGGPYLVARLGDASQSWLSGQTHEYGNTLLLLAGLFNLLAVADGVEIRRANHS